MKKSVKEFTKSELHYEIVRCFEIARPFTVIEEKNRRLFLLTGHDSSSHKLSEGEKVIVKSNRVSSV